MVGNEPCCGQGSRQETFGCVVEMVVVRLRNSPNPRKACIQTSTEADLPMGGFRQVASTRDPGWGWIFRGSRARLTALKPLNNMLGRVPVLSCMATRNTKPNPYPRPQSKTSASKTGRSACRCLGLVKVTTKRFSQLQPSLTTPWGIGLELGALTSSPKPSSLPVRRWSSDKVLRCLLRYLAYGKYPKYGETLPHSGFWISSQI